MPPIPTTASQYRTKMQFLVGGPSTHVRDATLANGIPAETAASSTIANLAGFSMEWHDGLVLADASDFLSRGAFRVTVPSSIGDLDFWYTYEVRDGNTFYGIEPVFQRKSEYTAHYDNPVFPVGTVVAQWAEITDLVKRWTLDNNYAEGESYWVMKLEGVEWNSLQLYAGASILAVATHEDNILGAHDPSVWFAGSVQEVQSRGNPYRNTWQATCEGIRADLLLQRNNPGYIGGDLVDGIWTASEALADVSAEPLEGDHPSSFAIANINNGNVGDLYVAKDVPSVSLRNGNPIGTEETDSRVLPKLQLPNSGIGLKIDFCYFNPQPTATTSAQRQKFMVLYNAHQIDPPDRDFGTTVDPKVWGVINVSDYHLCLMNRAGSLCGNTGRFTVVYLGTKNGGPAPEIKLKPNCGIVIGYDEPVFRSQWSLPDGWLFLDIRQCSGEKPGREKNITQTGVGLAWDPDPAGCIVAVRGGGRPNIQDDGRYTALVVNDSTTSIQLDSSLATWDNDGWIRDESTNQLVYYSAIDYGTNTLTGCVRLRWNGNPIGAGVRVDLQHDASFWWDMVVIGEPAASIVPLDFPVKRVGDFDSPDDGTFKNQNDGPKGERVWGIYNNGGASPIYYEDDALNLTGFVDARTWGAYALNRKYAPAIPLLQAIRRKSTMGGGIFNEKPTGPAFYNHDSNTYADWEISSAPRLGNIDELNSFVWLQYEVAEHEAAVCVVDTSDVGVTPDGTITVKENQAREYPTSMTNEKICHMRAYIGGGATVDFLYTGRTGDTFTGVTKIHGGAGVEIPAASTFKKRINSKANWNVSGPDVYIEANLPAATGMSIERWTGDHDCEILDYTSGTITVRPGQAQGFPASGTLILWPVVETIGGMTVISATLGASVNPDQYRATYSARTDSAFTGVVLLGNTPAAGWTVTPLGGGTSSFPADMDILGTRESSPIDPLLFIDRNESWDILYKSAFGNQVDGTALPAGIFKRFYPFGSVIATNPYYARFYVKVHRTSDGGRVKANEIKIHKYPIRAGGSMNSTTALADWSAVYDTATFIHDILLDAGVDESRMKIDRGGSAPIVRNPIADSSIWKTATSFATMGSQFVTNTADNKIYVREDPQATGAPFTFASPFVIDGDAVHGDIEAQERPRRAVAQVRLEARNAAVDQYFPIAYPSIANTDGEIVTISNKLVASEEAALKMAGLYFRRANGGWLLKVPTGPFACVLEYGDILRVAVTVDVAGRFFAQEFMVTGIHQEGYEDKLFVTAQLREWTTP